MEETALSNRFGEIEEEMDRNYYHQSTDKYPPTL